MTKLTSTVLAICLGAPVLARAQSAQPVVFVADVVDERPKRLSGPSLNYPDPLRDAKVEGRVLIEAVIDTSGHVEPRSVRVIQSPNPEFDPPAMDYVLRSKFRPGRVHGRAVRVLLQVPVDFRIKH